MCTITPMTPSASDINPIKQSRAQVAKAFTLTAIKVAISVLATFVVYAAAITAAVAAIFVAVDFFVLTGGMLAVFQSCVVAIALRTLTSQYGNPVALYACIDRVLWSKVVVEKEETKVEGITVKDNATYIVNNYYLTPDAMKDVHTRQEVDKIKFVS